MADCGITDNSRRIVDPSHMLKTRIRQGKYRSSMNIVRRSAKRLFPASSLRGVLLRIALENAGTPWRIGRRLNGTNIANYRRLKDLRFVCIVCGNQTRATYDMPDQIGRAHV